jgi:hypothetical protein
VDAAHAEGSPKKNLDSDLHNIRMDQAYDDVFDERALLIETSLGNRWMKVLAAQLHEQTSQFPQALTGAQ